MNSSPGLPRTSRTRERAFIATPYTPPRSRIKAVAAVMACLFGAMAVYLIIMGV